MYIAEVCFDIEKETEKARRLIDNLTAFWRHNGQVLGREFPIFFTDNVYRIILMLPQANSLADEHDDKYVARGKSQLVEAGFQSPRVAILGEAPFSAEPCSCSHSSYFILYTYYVALESCLRCGDCFGPIPLYAIPQQDSLEEGDLHDQIISWQSDYQSCDHLQMNCQTGEKFGLREISNYDSSLSVRGRKICDRITKALETPTYYYLHRYRGRSDKSERKRQCPSCGGDWLLPEQIHNKFDNCRLLSNIAISLS